MQVVHATFYPGEGKKAVSILESLGVNIEDYKLIESETGDLLIVTSGTEIQMWLLIT